MGILSRKGKEKAIIRGEKKREREKRLHHIPATQSQTKH
jgi:hypothetical protein